MKSRFLTSGQWCDIILGIICALAIWAALGCKNLPPLELCYQHPKYGQVCVHVGGQHFIREDLTPAQRTEVEAWMKTQPHP